MLSKLTEIGKRAAGTRWCLTGTPIQNEVLDLYSLSRFLQIIPFSGGTSKDFEEYFNLNQINGKITRTKVILGSFIAAHMLRRVKEDVIDDLVSKTEEIIELEFDQGEKYIYTAFQRHARSQFNNFKQNGTIKYSHVLVALLRLRQISDHPYLAVKKETSTVRFVGYGNMRNASYHDEDCLAKSKAYEGCSKVLHTKEITNEVVLDGDQIYKQMSKHMSNSGMLQRRIIWRKTHRAKGKYRTQQDKWNEEKMNSTSVMVRNQIKKPQTGQTEWNRFQVNESIEFELPEDNLNGYSDEDKYPTLVGGLDFIPSSKTKMLLQKLRWIRKNKPNDKVIVFSQFRTMLWIVTRVLEKYHIRYLKYDGSTTGAARQTIINTFNQDASSNTIPVLLMSLKCAALGLNLTVANHVILLDLWWNPAIEQQAIDRVHRIGQNKPVYVTRLIMKSSIEEKILQLQQKKQSIADSALFSAKCLTSETLSKSDIALLLDDLFQDNDTNTSRSRRNLKSNKIFSIDKDDDLEETEPLSDLPDIHLENKCINGYDNNHHSSATDLRDEFSIFILCMYYLLYI